MPESITYRILLVDDDEPTREVSSSLLESRGHQVECAASGDQALAALRRLDTRFDMVLLDLVMPGRDGFETLREIRSEYPSSRLPVFVVTARESMDDIRRALELGANDFLVKPLDAGISLSKIQATLQVQRQTSRKGPPGPGDRLGSKYRLQELVGSGGFGTVYRATHLDLELDLAIKILHRRAFSDFRTRSRLKTEGIVLAKLDHPNTVRVWDLVTSDDPPYLVMDFLEGRPLAEVMADGGPMPPRLACRFAAQIANGLRAAHRLDLVHRDVKPQNIFLCRNQPEGSVVKLLDFGLAGWANETSLEHSGGSHPELLGTPRYLAPERILGHRGGKPSDIYSLGIVLFEMLAGRFPYPLRSTSVASLIEAHSVGKVSRFSDLGVAAPALLEGLIRWMLRREPENRPDSDQVLRSIDEIAAFMGKNVSSGGAKGHPDLPQADTIPIDLAELGESRDG